MPNWKDGESDYHGYDRYGGEGHTEEKVLDLKKKVRDSLV